MCSERTYQTPRCCIGRIWPELKCQVTIRSWSYGRLHRTGTTPSTDAQSFWEDGMELASSLVSTRKLSGIQYFYRDLKGQSLVKDFNRTKLNIVARRPVMLDIGSAYGEQAIVMAKFWPDAYVIAVEPNSGVAVFPNTIAPAATRRATWIESSSTR